MNGSNEPIRPVSAILWRMNRPLPPADAKSTVPEDFPEHDRLRVWFDAALDVPESGRDAWLQEQTIAQDQRALLRRLLAAHSQPDYLETPAI